MTKAMEEVCELLSFQIGSKGLSFPIYIPNLPEVYCDANRLKQVNSYSLIFISNQRYLYLGRHKPAIKCNEIYDEGMGFTESDK